MSEAGAVATVTRFLPLPSCWIPSVVNRKCEQSQVDYGNVAKPRCMMGMKMIVEDEEEEDYGNKEVYDFVS